MNTTQNNQTKVIQTKSAQNTTFTSDWRGSNLIEGVRLREHVPPTRRPCELPRSPLSKR